MSNVERSDFLESMRHDFVARDSLLHVLLGVERVWIELAASSSRSDRETDEPDWEMADVILGLQCVWSELGLGARSVETSTSVDASPPASAWSRSHAR